MLSNSIALIAVAVLLGVEAWKASGGIARVVLTLLAVAFALSGALLKWLTGTVPRLGQIVADTFSQPAAWFVLLVALFFVVRPLWTSKAPAIEHRASPYLALASDAGMVAHNITTYRATKRVFRDMLPAFLPMLHNGMALLLSFQKEGFYVPSFHTSEGERVAVGMEHYFTVIAPLLRAGHIDEAKGLSASLSQEAERRSQSFQLDKWWTSNEFY